MKVHISIRVLFSEAKRAFGVGVPRKEFFLDYLITWVIPESLCELSQFFSPSLFISSQMLDISNAEDYFKKQFTFLSFARQISTWSLTLFLNQLHLYLHVLQENSVDSTLKVGHLYIQPCPNHCILIVLSSAFHIKVPDFI